MEVGVDHDFGIIEGLAQKKVRGSTHNFAQQEAMTAQESEQCVEVGFQLAGQYAEQGAGLVGAGEMGIGSTTSASARLQPPALNPGLNKELRFCRLLSD